MKILNLEVPDEVKLIFHKWCKYLEYPETEQTLIMFFKDCHLNHCDENNYHYNSTTLSHEIRNSNGSLVIASWTLFHIPYIAEYSIIDRMNNKLNENIRNNNT